MSETIPERPETRECVRLAVAAALEIKATDLSVRHLTPVTDFTDFFVICSAANERQAQAIADKVEERLRERGVRPLHSEGHNVGQWILLDYGDFVLHVFQEERRRFYALERLWGDAPDVTSELAA
ncbi:MAG: ribosome silencing factor [Acidobacteria bacterium]|jgi:ribosome-associated protein|nr:ribosome silencing factor [Thermoanaerobaculia bacterium]MDI9632108.1 ribosome silencing factor [Acidobacteriota bacterium]OQC41994.1 MAG: Ribosomal silencing factor RsfS [Acidobacteria bacterium ADurb.Bin051]MBP7812708.1 ribosome silencing factor [Thermoanaerobaculia bacterium]MBP8844770.1 ribosome silencing factor [Thermoanaerobaculia bacterium]